MTTVANTRERPDRPANRNHISPQPTSRTKAINPCPLTTGPHMGDEAGAPGGLSAGAKRWSPSRRAAARHATRQRRKPARRPPGATRRPTPRSVAEQRSRRERRCEFWSGPQTCALWIVRIGHPANEKRQACASAKFCVAHISRPAGCRGRERKLGGRAGLPPDEVQSDGRRVASGWRSRSARRYEIVVRAQVQRYRAAAPAASTPAAPAFAGWDGSSSGVERSPPLTALRAMMGRPSRCG